MEALYERIAREIARREALLLVCRDPAHGARVGARLRAAGVRDDRLILVCAPCNDTWVRDYGPLTVMDRGSPRLLDFRFNGWGGRFPADLDDGVSARLAAVGVFGPCALQATDLVVEGGALETDGEGTLLATCSSLVDQRRNPGMDRGDVESALGTLLGFDRFLWLEEGRLLGDDTDGHIDTLARFCDRDTIVYARAPRSHPDFPSLREMERQLSAFSTRSGAGIRLRPLPCPRPRFDRDGRHLPASYANFLLVNGAVLMPVYGDPADGSAVRCLQACFPRRDVLPFDCTPLIRQNGSLHCITMQFPGALPLRPPA